MIPRDILEFSRILKLNDKTTKIEVRFRTNYEQFMNVQNFLIKYTKKLERTKVIEWNQEGLMKINRNNEEFWLERKSIRKFVSKEYPFEFLIYKENFINPILTFEPNIARIIKRSSTYIYEKRIMVFLNNVNSKIKNMSDKKKFEINLEIIETSIIDKLNKVIEIFLKKIFNTFLLYTFSEKMTISNYIKEVVGGYAKINHPVHISWYDLNYNIIENYRIAHKIDGERKLLVFHSTGIWLFSHPDSFSKVSESNEKSKLFEGAILDGELVVEDRAKGELKNNYYSYAVFDCISRSALGRPDTSIQKEDHDTRLRHCQVVAENYKDRDLFVFTLNFRSFNSPDDFFERVRELLTEETSYETDGIIFYPRNSPYKTKILKWKPLIKLSVDLMYKGGRIWGYKNIQVDIPFKLTFRANDGDIIEFVYRNNMLVSYRARYDKFSPNGEKAIESFFNAIKYPITEEIIKGDSFELLKLYHRKIIKSLINYPKEIKSFLDINIGSHRKYLKKIKNYYIVEPNEKVKKKLSGYLKPNFITLDNVNQVDFILVSKYFENLTEFSGKMKEILEYRGIMAFLNIDGNAVEQIFRPKIHGPVFNNLIEIWGGSIFLEENKYFINTINFHEEGFLFYIQDLVKFLMPEITLVMFERANKERFLTNKERVLSSLYAYGIFVRFNDDQRIGKYVVCMIDDDFPELHPILKATYKSYREIPSGHYERWFFGKKFKSEFGSNLEEIAKVVKKRIHILNEQGKIMKSYGHGQETIEIYGSYLVVP
jgi:hypothetical protein